MKAYESLDLQECVTCMEEWNVSMGLTDRCKTAKVD